MIASSHRSRSVKLLICIAVLFCVAWLPYFTMKTAQIALGHTDSLAFGHGIHMAKVSMALFSTDAEWREGDCKDNKWRKNNRKHDMQEGDRGESDSREGGRDKGQEMREVDATGGKTNERKEVRGDVTKRKSITRTMTGRKGQEIKEQQRKRQGKSQQPGRCKTEELL
ncbi:hypothetical protein NP493_1690g00016 [Ridgeia piscesae]|uniref:Uncharacterized protein n=1 Tax=Ridgeia piscesae TaxID=27915 RepID=A0AAD9JV62_RIDPI|nr:hypothetical protein NP493_1690g00016 [Ridgeia piscesae]